MSFLDLLALRKAKLGGKYQAPEEQRHEVAGELNQEEVRDEESEEVRDEVRDKVSEEEDQRNEVRSGGDQKRNLSIVKRLEPTREDSVAKTLAPKKGTIKTSAGFMLVDQEEPTENVEVIEKIKKGRKRTLSDRLLEPIKEKKAGRCKKVNVTSWRNQVLTMKKKASRMQIEAGAEPNFLIIMFNNVQDPHASNPSASAGKYLTYGEGPIKEKLMKEGLKFDKSMYMMANNHNFAEEKVFEENLPEEDMEDEPELVEEQMRVKRTNIVNQTKEQTERRLSEAQKSATHFQRGVEKTHKIAEKRRKIEAKVDASEKALGQENVVAKKWRPKKVATPGTFLDTSRTSSSDEEA